MKVKIQKEIGVTAIIIVVFGIFISLFLYYWFQVRPPYEDLSDQALRPMNPDYHYFAGNNRWRVDTLQPVFIEVFRRDKGDYILAQYTDIYGRPYQLEIYVSGDAGGGYFRKNLARYDLQGNETESLTIDEIRKDFEKGEQLYLEYLSKTDDQIDIVSADHPRNLYFSVIDRLDFEPTGTGYFYKGKASAVWISKDLL